jgi:carbon-monoxide dehydrogenase medium subunit
MAGIALYYDVNGGKAANAHVGVIGVGDRPQRLPDVETVLNGSVVDEATITRAEQAAAASVEPTDDIHASATYRRALTGTMVERALKSASA